MNKHYLVDVWDNYREKRGKSALEEGEEYTGPCLTDKAVKYWFDFEPCGIHKGKFIQPLEIVVAHYMVCFSQPEVIAYLQDLLNQEGWKVEGDFYPNGVQQLRVWKKGITEYTTSKGYWRDVLVEAANELAEKV